MSNFLKNNILNNLTGNVKGLIRKIERIVTSRTQSSKYNVYHLWSIGRVSIFELNINTLNQKPSNQFQMDHVSSVVHVQQVELLQTHNHFKCHQTKKSKRTSLLSSTLMPYIPLVQILNPF